MLAEGAKRLEQFAMHVNQRFRPGGFVQRVDVLGDDRRAAVLGLEPGEGEVGRVWLDAVMCPPPRIVEGVNLGGIEQKAFWRCYLPPVVFRPYAVGVAKGRDAAFSG